MKGPALSLAFLLVVPTCVFAQQLDCRHRTVPVSIVHDNQAPIIGFAAENFRGELRGTPVRVVSAKLQTNPKRIVILYDLGGRMGLVSRYRAAASLISHALNSLPNGTRVGLITFAEKPVVQTDRLQDVKAVQAFLRETTHLNSQSIQGLPALWDAVAEAVRLLEPAQTGDVIYAVTEGIDVGSRVQVQQVEEALLGSGIRFFATIFEQTNEETRGMLRAYLPAEVGLLAENTGGLIVKFPLISSPTGDRHDLSPKAMKRIQAAADKSYSHMAQFYLVEIELKEDLDKPRSWKLQFVSEHGQPLKGFDINYPRKLPPCSATTIKKAAQP